MKVKDMLSSVDAFFSRTLWEIEAAGLHKRRRLLVSAVRLVCKLADDFRQGEFSVRASSLVYTTLLTFVPLLAIAFTVLKSLGVQNMVAPLLLQFLQPIGDKSTAITDSIVEYVDKINVKILGAVGLAMLLYTVTSTIQQIENAFNHFWQITQSRPMLEKFRDYLSVILAGPILIVASLSITTAIMSHKIVQKLRGFEPFGTGIIYFGKLLPVLLIISAFTMFFYLLPNTKVRLRSALVGGSFAGILWQVLSWAFAKFLVSTSQYSAIYSGFAIVLVFMIWLYFNWLIMLVGVKVTFYHQFPTALGMRHDRVIFTERFKYRLALTVMYMIGLHYHHDKPRWTLKSLVSHLGLPVAPVLEVLHALQDRKILLLIKEDMTYLPAKDIDATTVSEVLLAVQQQFLGDKMFGDNPCAMPVIGRLIDRLDESVMKTFSEETIKSLISAPDAMACEMKRDQRSNG
jgi:membrane protein